MGAGHKGDDAPRAGQRAKREGPELLGKDVRASTCNSCITNCREAGYVPAGLGMRLLIDTIQDVLQTPTQLKPLSGGLQAATPIDPTREEQLLTAWLRERTA